MRPHTIKADITAEIEPLRRQIAEATEAFNRMAQSVCREPMSLDGWIAPRRQPLVHVERSRGYVAHVWVGWLGLHLAWPPHHSRLDFCADWWR